MVLCLNCACSSSVVADPPARCNPVELPKDNLTSFRYTIGARLNRNFTVVATYAIGDIQRDLDYARELSIFATVKF